MKLAAALKAAAAAPKTAKPSEWAASSRTRPANLCAGSLFSYNQITTFAVHTCDADLRAEIAFRRRRLT